jgi:hypothetical protein
MNNKLTKVSLTSALAALLLLVAAMPAAAAGPIRATFSEAGNQIGFNPDPVAVAARCPGGADWITSGAGSGELSSAVYSGTYTLTNEHCATLTVPGYDRGHIIGKADAGVMTMHTPVGQLHLRYKGTFVLFGDPRTGSYVSVVHLEFTVTGGTGDFAGARGDGSLKVVDRLVAGSESQTGELNGSLIL